MSSHPHRRPAFTLILAIVVIGALGVTMGVLGAHFAATLRAARSADLEIRAAQVLHGGVAWAASHRQELQNLTDSGVIDLQAPDVCPPGYRATVSIRSLGPGRGWSITALIARGPSSATLECVVENPRPAVP